jgi:MATE family multidrug resistance protein
MSLLSQSLSENRRTLALAAPIVAGFVGQMAMGWADTIMVGRLGVVPLAACAFANTVLAVPLVFGFGVLSSISVRASHAHGAENAIQAGETLRAGLVLAAVLGLAVALAIQFGLPLVPLLGQKPEVNVACVNFLLLCAWSVVPVYLTTAAKNFCEALSRPWVPFWIMLASVLLNVGLNWLLIYGHWGFPALGLEGAGLATLLARLAATLALMGYLFMSRDFRPRLPREWFGPGLGAPLRALVGIGLPVGGLHFCEVSGFAFGSIMMGWISVDALAAHQIAITCAATTFMLPLGISQAVSVRIGQARGARQLARCRPIIYGALGITFGLMAVFAVIFLTAGGFIAGWFITSEAIIALTVQLLLIAGVFQLFDGVQIISSGALRGFEDTRAPMVIGAVAYWVVALPVSGLLAFGLGVGAPGIWGGFVAGLAVAAAALFSRVQRRLGALKIPA